MARTKETSVVKKEPGRMKQMWQVFRMTRRNDPASQWYMLTGLLIPILIAVVVTLIFAEGNVLSAIVWIATGVLAGFLAVLIILGRRAERAAYAQIDGQPGAVGAVLRTGLRGGWIGNEMPIAVNPKSQDAVYRAVGRGGVVLISEGDAGRGKRMLADEKRKTARVIPNVPITLISVGNAEGSVRLHHLAKTLRKTKRSLTKPEVLAVSNRLSSLQSSLPIPKGIDPAKARVQRGKVR
ncbi:MAG: hypothetical protein B5766_06725 [Candidatus Lumbricidophila eiseniae]|uniref:DUF4191 domain-containing protein n=1 Tax=Candidatus Lumbricidiphila eiseniae TaxID=1969409 RepID=A0A2A6FRI5_9MICO|nr:MAG: hypothetical protein B5766_06725 [Candidatus Lumbricidophila eiseniae]